MERKTKMHSLACLLTAWACLSLCNAGCSGGGADEPVGPEPPVEEPEKPEKPARHVRLEYLISPDKQLGEISPYIYGTNVEPEFSHSKQDPSRMVRLGGNRTTGYNWENNASNAGSDWQHYSDNYLESRIEGSDGNVPGSILSTFVDNCLKNGQTPLVTMPMCYSVAADKDGEVAEGDRSRWVELTAKKGSAFSLDPDLTDGKVYTDECVNFLTQKVGGKRRILYSLDNEPDLWHHTHPRISPSRISCEEFVARSAEFASAIKEVDGQAVIFGLVSYGFDGYLSMANAPGWKALKDSKGYEWFLDYYLE